MTIQAASNPWGTIVVPAEGPENGRIVIIGEAPGAKEEELGRPFVGGAGKVLDGLLEEAGLSRADVYITNLVKVRPKGNDFGVFYSGKEPLPILRDGIAAVLEEIMRIRPNVVVCLGNEPLKAITGKTAITKWRGSILSATMPNGMVVKVIPSYHPAAILRNWEFRPVALFDMIRIAKESKTPDVRLRTRRLITNPDYNEVMRELARLKTSPTVAFDIETETDQITCIGFSDSPDWAICVPFWYGSSGSLWGHEQEVSIWLAIKELLEGPNQKIAQNAQYDMTMLADLMGINVKNLWVDTMIAGHLAYPELPKGLEFLTSIYTDQPYYKDWIREGDMRKYWEYNCLDACCTFEVALAVKGELEELGMWNLYLGYIHQLIQPLMDISRRGVAIDLPLRKVAVKQYKTKMDELQSELDELIGHELNVMSPKQMQAWLYSEIGFKPKYKRRAGNVQTVTADEDAIRDLARTNPRREFDLIVGDANAPQESFEWLGLRGIKKVLSTYLEAPLDSDGRIRTTYLITGTETGRLSSRESVHGTGTNLQNIPKGIARRLFVPDGERIFVSGDLSQAEARIVAYLAGEDSLIRLFQNGGDIHRRNAAAIFRVPESSVTDKQRQLAKRVVHASNYGMGPVTFAKQAGIHVSEAKRLLNAYFATYPGIKLWQMRVVQQLAKARMLTTPFGRKRLFMGAFTEDMKKAAYAYVPQSTVSDILNSGLLRLNDQLCQYGDIMLQVHDSVVVQCYPESMPTVCTMIKTCLEIPVDIAGADGRVRSCVVPTTMECGWTWGDLVPLKEPYTDLPERQVGIHAE